MPPAATAGAAGAADDIVIVTSEQANHDMMEQVTAWVDMFVMQGGDSCSNCRNDIVLSRLKHASGGDRGRRRNKWIRLAQTTYHVTKPTLRFAMSARAAVQLAVVCAPYGALAIRALS